MLRYENIVFLRTAFFPCTAIVLVITYWDYPPCDRPQVERQRYCRWTAGTGFNLDNERGRTFRIPLGRFLTAKEDSGINSFFSSLPWTRVTLHS